MKAVIRCEIFIELVWGQVVLHLVLETYTSSHAGISVDARGQTSGMFVVMGRVREIHFEH